MVERLREMKSYNHLYEKFISDENIRLAIKNWKARRIAKKKPTIHMIKQTLSYLGWFTQTNTYNVFSEKFAKYINIQNLKRRVRRYDKRMAKLPRGLQTCPTFC